MVFALVLVSIAFLVTFGILLFGRKSAAELPPRRAAASSGSASTGQGTGEDSRLRQLESDLSKRQKELDEQRRQLAETRDELKQAKKKLFEQKESEKESRGLVKARTEVERSASAQLELVRQELATAHAEIDRLRTERGPRREPRERPQVAAPQVASQVPAPAEPEKPKRVIRELSEADKERMERLERDAKKAKEKSADVERELKRLKGRLETEKRVYVVTRSELDLLKDKYKAIEKRMNRTLLADDLLRRAIRDLEKKTGIAAERTEPSAEELAASDTATEERVNAEAEKDAERHASKLHAAEEAAARAAEVTAKAEAEAQAQAEQPQTAEPDADAHSAEPSAS